MISFIVASQHYYFRPKRHDIQFLHNSNRLFGNNLINTHVVSEDSYYCSLCISCVVSTFNKDDVDADDDAGLPTHDALLHDYKLRFHKLLGVIRP